MDYVPPVKEYNGSVLTTQLSKLVSCIVDPIKMICYTVESDLVVRIWCLTTGSCKKSYKVETREDSTANSNNPNANSVEKHKI